MRPSENRICNFKNNKSFQTASNLRKPILKSPASILAAGRISF